MKKSIVFCAALLFVCICLSACISEITVFENEETTARQETTGAEETVDTEETVEVEETESDTEVPPHDHVASDWRVDVEATCSAKGSRHKECTVCGKTMETQNINKITHTMSAWIIDTEATCTTTGAKHRECTVCGKELTSSTIEATHTDLRVLEGKAQTCTETGLTEGLKCQACGETVTAQVEIPTHTREAIPAIASSCTEGGMTEGVKCSACHEVLAEPVYVPPAHTPGDRVIELEAGLFCGDDGHYRETVSCKICNEPISDETPALPERHSMSNNACVICGLPQSTVATGVLYTLNPDGKSYYVHLGFDFTGTDLVVGVYNGLSVTVVGGSGGSETLRTLVLGDCVKTMGSFSECPNLIYAKIGNGVKEIPYLAFYHCTSLSTVVIGTGVEKIGEDAFRGCNSLYSVYMPDTYDWMYFGNNVVRGRWLGNSSTAARYLKDNHWEWYRMD